MLLDLASRPLASDPYSTQPFTFLEQDAQRYLANITAIDLVENGDRRARESWQNRQLRNLLKHARSHSKFWRLRIPQREISHATLKYMPILSRNDIAKQSKLEGSLVAANGANAPNYSSTGSTGTPVAVYFCPENAYYNIIRSIAQYFINGLSLEEDRLQVAPTTNLARVQQEACTARLNDAWAGPLSKVFRNGKITRIAHNYDDDALIKELSKHRFGYLVCPNRYIDLLIKKAGVEFLKERGVKLWVHRGDYREPENVEALATVGIRSLSNYSAGEIGPIAFECSQHQGYFHVAHTNVVVERDDELTTSFNGMPVGRLLITHLHSYATPLIRYDIGDFAQLDQQCPCGHDGPTLSNIFGRGKHFLRHPNGKLVPFYISTRVLLAVVGFDECRFRQTEIDCITVELGGRESISAEEEENLKKVIIKATDPAFRIDIKPVKEIDWSANPKRLFFTSSFA